MTQCRMRRPSALVIGPFVIHSAFVLRHSSFLPACPGERSTVGGVRSGGGGTILAGMMKRVAIVVLAVVVALRVGAEEAAAIRVGIIGCDTSHVPAFTKILNDPKAAGDVAGFKVVAAFAGGSPDIASSRDRVAGFTEGLRKSGVEIV